MALEDTYANEVLTDTSAFIYGLGYLVLQGMQRNVTEFERRADYELHVQTVISKTGYLTGDEYGFLLAYWRRSESLRRRYLPRSKWIRGFLKTGGRRLKDDAWRPPVRQTPIGLRIRYQQDRARFVRHSSSRSEETGLGYRFERDENSLVRVIFRCPECFQRLRLPVGLRRLVVTCPNCTTKIPCRT